MPRFIDLTGKSFGRWIVLSRLPNVRTSTMWECRCACGTVKAVRAAHLSTGASVCCGCVVKPRKHGQAVGGRRFPKKYRTWRQIKARCCNPNHKNAAIYQGLLCEAWKDFSVFDVEIPDPPSEDSTIDRIHNNRGYEPGNVRWITMAEQHRNQRNCRWIEFAGKTQLLTDWAREFNVSDSTMHERIKRWGTPQGRS